jgi:hypothetical protein
MAARRRRPPCYTLLIVAGQPRYVPPMPFLLDLLAIAACGGAGALLAWLLVSAIGWTGVGGAIAMAATGMLAATLLWVSGVALLRRLGLLK